MSDEVELAIYRIAQEGLTNAVRHAGATTITIGVRLNEDDLALHITDDGHAPPGAPADGAGLRGMRERALMIGALLSIQASRPHGLRIELTIPTAHLGG